MATGGLGNTTPVGNNPAQPATSGLAGKPTPAPKPDFVIAWTEPTSPANTEYQPVYPYNNITATRAGHSFELDDTPTRERIRLQHGKGTFLEMHPNGDEVHKIVRDGYTITLGDHNIKIGVDDGKLAKKLNITVYGDVYMNVKGDKIEEIDGNFEQHIKGHYTQTVEKTSTVTSFGDMQINGGSSLTGSLEINSSTSVVMGADLVVGGEIMCAKLIALSRVDAGSGMSIGASGLTAITTALGLPGGNSGLVVHGTGGIAVGLPIAIPGSITSVGPINSFTQMSAPLSSSILSGSILKSDIINTLLRKLHFHIAPEGATSPWVGTGETKAQIA